MGVPFQVGLVGYAKADPRQNNGQHVPLKIT